MLVCIWHHAASLTSDGHKLQISVYLFFSNMSQLQKAPVQTHIHFTSPGFLGFFCFFVPDLLPSVLAGVQEGKVSVMVEVRLDAQSSPKWRFSVPKR